MTRTTSTQSQTRTLLTLLQMSMPPEDRDLRLRWTDRLCDLGFGSLQMLSLFIELEQHFALTPRDLSRFNAYATIGSLVHLCLRCAPNLEESLSAHRRGLDAASSVHEPSFAPGAE
jgi:hypothetical protein